MIVTLAYLPQTEHMKTPLFDAGPPPLNVPRSIARNTTQHHRPFARAVVGRRTPSIQRRTDSTPAALRSSTCSTPRLPPPRAASPPSNLRIVPEFRSCQVSSPKFAGKQGEVLQKLTAREETAQRTSDGVSNRLSALTEDSERRSDDVNDVQVMIRNPQPGLLEDEPFPPDIASNSIISWRKTARAPDSLGPLRACQKF